MRRWAWLWLVGGAARAQASLVMPRLEGLSQSQAESSLRSAGFSRWRVVHTPGERAGLVRKQSPAPGQKCGVPPEIYVTVARAGLEAPRQAPRAPAPAGPGWGWILLWHVGLVAVALGIRRLATRPRPAGKRALTLLEVMLSFLILAFVVLGMQSMYLGIMHSTKFADQHQEAAAALRTAVDFARFQARSSWPIDAPPDLPTVEVGQVGDYTYQIDDPGRLRDPLDPSKFMNLKQISVRLYYLDPNDGSRKHLDSICSVGR